MSPLDADLRELVAVREIVHAFLTADRPEDVFRFALERVSPVVGATFASVYLIDGASELMRLAAAYNWPRRHQPWLGEMRVRLGFGPSGEAASERRAIEVPDVMADGGLEDWQEVAAELGFRALIALPLQTARGVLGTVTFYFAEAGAFSSERRGLLRIVAGQMAATAEKAALIDQLRRANAALTASKAELEEHVLAVLEARRVKDEFLTNVTHELRTPLTAVMGYLSLLQEEYSGPLTEHQRSDVGMAREASERLLGLIDMLLEITTGTQPSTVKVESFDPREPIRDAVATTRGRSRETALVIDDPTAPEPLMRSDRAKITRILECLLSNAYKFTASGVVTVSLKVSGGCAIYRVRDTGIGVPPEAQAIVFDDFRQADGSLT
ncbi:MAG TPA: GAF domain-containing sensor histidine kinase, partial [Gemmatimonadaceae bacterium]|nr:GAF domain-containing sensor histidine kinase [Gemmatimonadaceae bacterium]